MRIIAALVVLLTVLVLSAICRAGIRTVLPAYESCAVFMI